MQYTQSPCGITFPGGGHLGKMPLKAPLCCAALSLQSCLTLYDPMDYSPPGSSVHGDPPGTNTGVGCHALLKTPWETVRTIDA